jgi:hypothetical protein
MSRPMPALPTPRPWNGSKIGRGNNDTLEIDKNIQWNKYRVKRGRITTPASLAAYSSLNDDDLAFQPLTCAVGLSNAAIVHTYYVFIVALEGYACWVGYREWAP